MSLRWKRAGGAWSDQRLRGHRDNGVTYLLRFYSPEMDYDTEYCFEVTPRRTNLPDGPPSEICTSVAAPAGPPTVKLLRVQFNRVYQGSARVWAVGETDMLLDDSAVYAESNGELIRETHLDLHSAGAYHLTGNQFGVLTVPLPYQDTCFRIAGIVGTGDLAHEGAKSNEICVTAAPEEQGTNTRSTQNQIRTTGMNNFASSQNNPDGFDNSNSRGDPLGDVMQALGLEQ